MKIYWIIGVLFLFTACAEHSSEIPEASRAVKLNMAVEGIDKFEQYIHSLTVYAFKKSDGDSYRFYRVLAELDGNDIRQLADGGRPGDNFTTSKVLEVEIEAGDYQFYFVANTQAFVENSFQPGVTSPEEVQLLYPAEGLYNSYFLGKSTVIAGGESDATSVVLQRVVSGLLLWVYGVPDLIDTVFLQVTGMARAITLDGRMSSPGASVEHAFIVKDTNVGETNTAIFDLLSFPTMEEDAGLKLVFRSRMGVEKTKMIPLVLQSDKYVEIKGKISSEDGALLSFDIIIQYFLPIDWHDIKLPDFVLKPQGE